MPPAPGKIDVSTRSGKQMRRAEMHSWGVNRPELALLGHILEAG